MTDGRKISTCLWFDDNAEEAVEFYLSIFKNSNIASVLRYGEAGPGPAGSVLSIAFELDGREFVALNGGPMFKFTEAISLVVKCDTQKELDQYWEKLLDGGAAQQCGWLKDKFGLSWQIVPTALDAMLRDEDPEKANRVMNAVLQMVKLDINALQQTYDQ